jgi:hypothetical protein
MRKNKDDSAGSGLQKSASWSDFDTNPVGNKEAPASSIDPAAKVEDNAKQEAAKAKLEAVNQAAAAAAKMEAAKQPAAAKVKAKQAAASSIDPVVKSEVKPIRKTQVVNMPVVRKEAAVISAGIESLGDDEIEYVRTHRTRNLESIPGFAKRCPTITALVKERVDLEEDILRQYDTKGYALAWVERLDNGRKRVSHLPEEETA